MSPNHFEISFVIVHYGHGDEVFKCLKKLQVIKNKFKSSEFILVDNNEEKLEKTKIKRLFPWIKYLSPKTNLGWGAGRNFGLQNATGKYLISIDSDILIDYKSFKNIYEKISTNKNIGMVSPRIKNISGRYTPEATEEMTPFVGVLFLSMFSKFFPNNYFLKKFLMKSWNRKTSRNVSVGQLGGFIMKRKVYEEIGKFDENLFLYFEENDIAKRLEKYGYKIYFDAKSEVIHLESKGTPKSSDYIQNVFRKSRMHYFKKHYGIIPMLIVEFFARISKESILLFVITLIAVILRFYKINENLIFHGEIGRDYLNAYDMLHGTRTWLLGPRTSHEWFFIPPIAFWIYAILLKIGNYSPFIISYFWGVVGSLVPMVCYSFIKKIFDQKIGLISAFLIAISPTWIMLTRDSRYNAMAAILFIPFYYLVVKIVRKEIVNWFYLGLLLGIMMSFFPSPLLLIPSLIAVVIIFKIKVTKKDVLNIISGFLIPNIFYIFSPEVIKNLVIWVPYRILGFFTPHQKNSVNSMVLLSNFSTLIKFLLETLPILLIGTIFNRKIVKEVYVLLIIFAVSYLGLFVHGNPPIHYFLVILPIPIILTSYFISKFDNKYIFALLAIFAILNFNNLKKVYILNSDIVPFKIQAIIINDILKDSGGNNVDLKRVGVNDKFEDNFAQNYIYMLKIKGVNLDRNSKYKYTIYEDGNNNAYFKKE